ncbi:FKBP-type peptidyl-prolyl cis-trans isomerase [Demequina muriae]|uniref:peptidylprolyl isomerase n=1 Tax=Demequina muriae TaxID=3051664 RepID=A0ABT8GF79_9MICO|nr:FKBP-type peptidyl-prolyl cis-trans isomerase [Demequina sp. EGI L300058]MDN4480085.1 FKBP-type peptidyl-prolyl cis-trans isomerase [Demequina sp. EGI L300058]
MKKHLPIAAVAAATLVLAGCASGTDDEASASPSPTDGAGGTETTEFGNAQDVAMLDEITWEEDGDGIPTLTVETPSTISGTATRIVEDGDGAAVESGQVVTVDYTITSGTDGSQLFSTYESDAPESLLVSETSLEPALYNALAGSSVGSDVIFATIDQTATDTPNAAIYMAMTITDVIDPLDRAEGEAVDPAEGLPTVTLDEAGVPSVEVGDAEMPTELEVQQLIEGPADGEVVELGDTVIAHYTGWIWDGEQFDSSWDRGEPTLFAFQEGQLIEGWTQGLAGQTVGSQVLLVIPPELGYGEQESEAIPADSTLVFVVDILAVA